MDRNWWKEAVVYQIYPKSFMDSNGDGIGDLRGIEQKLDYLCELGVDAVWICPFYQSPMVDNGYDISDYYAIDPVFGSMEDMEALIAEAKKRDIKILVDLVLNHTSSQHIWFRKALADPSSKYRDYYIFRNGKPEKEPSNWRGCFGGNVWESMGEDLYYYHTFDKEQPDLNWENPQLRKEVYDIINYWIGKGVGGFRIDAITYIKKNQDFPALPPDGSDGLASLFSVSQNEAGIDEFLQEMKEATYGKYDMLTVAEAPGVPYDGLGPYIGEKGHFSMIFDFSYNDIDVDESSNWYVKKEWSMKDVRDAVFKSQISIQEVGWGALYLENHDQPRCLNKYIPEEDIGYYSAAALAGMYFFLRGTPFIYQGQELGMTNTFFERIEDTKDLASVDQYQRALLAGLDKAEALEIANKRSRANTRTPMQWSSGQGADFTKATPWIAINDNYKKINAKEQQEDMDSIFHFYRKLISLRKDTLWKEVLIYGDIQPRFLDYPSVIAYERSAGEKKVLVITNFSKENISLEVGISQILLDNYKDTIVNKNYILLRAYETVMIEEKY